MRNWTTLLALSVALTVSAFAQHGAGHGNAGGGAMGGSHMGGSDMGTAMSGNARGNANQSGGYGSSSHTMASQSPDTALSKSPKLSSNLEKLLPSGMTAQQACSGFKNLGQCVAAIHVSHNLDVPFADLKAKMTGSSPDSLGKAIQTLKPAADAKAEAKKAKRQANQDLTETQS